MNSIPLVVDYLRSHSLSQLNAEHGVKTSAKDGDYFFSVNYDQIESKVGPLVNECRGLILCTLVHPLQDGQINGTDPVGDLYVLARPFDRFFNHGDSNAAEVDFNDPETLFFEKLDGTLCILYYNAELKNWHVATRAVPLADKSITGWGDWTFRKLFEKALTDTLTNAREWYTDFISWTKHLDKSCTYCFELTTPLNRIVVQYNDYRIHLLGIRRTSTGEAFDVVNLYGRNRLFGVSVCPSHKLSNLQELLTFVGSKSPMEQEGIVVCDKHHNRVKVKSLAYMAYNRVRDSAANSPRAVMELILAEKIDDVMPVLEVFVQEKAVKMQDGLRKLIHSVDQAYTDCFAVSQGTDNDRKAFALAIQAKKLWMAPLMERFSGKCGNLADYIQKKRDKNTSEWPTGLLDTLVELSLKD